MIPVVVFLRKLDHVTRDKYPDNKVYLTGGGKIIPYILRSAGSIILFWGASPPACAKY